MLLLKNDRMFRLELKSREKKRLEVEKIGFSQQCHLALKRERGWEADCFCLRVRVGISQNGAGSQLSAIPSEVIRTILRCWPLLCVCWANVGERKNNSHVWIISSAGRTIINFCSLLNLFTLAILYSVHMHVNDTARKLEDDDLNQQLFHPQMTNLASSGD